MSLDRVGEVVRRIVRRQAKAGISSTGRPHPPRADGAPSRLHESGNLLGSLEVVVEGPERVAVVATARHARHVEDGTRVQPPRPFIAPAPQFEAEVDAAALEHLDRMVLG